MGKYVFYIKNKNKLFFLKITVYSLRTNLIQYLNGQIMALGLSRAFWGSQ